MEVLASSSLSPIFTKPNTLNPNFSIQVNFSYSFSVSLLQYTWKLCLFSCKPVTVCFKALQVKLFVSQPSKTLKASSFRYPRNPSRSNANPGLVFVCNRYLCLLERNDHRKFSGKFMMKSSVSFRKNVSVALVRLVSVLLVSSISVVTTDSPSCKFIFIFYNHLELGDCKLMSFVSAGGLSEENLLFLEAWRTIDRAYIDKTFNGQSWFRYRESALRNEPMNNREETCMSFEL